MARKQVGASVRQIENEWVGGRFSMPSYVTGEGFYRPEVVVWLCPNGVVGFEVVRAEDADDALCALLLETFERPLVGAPRVPRAVRVNSPALVDPLRRAVGTRCRVVLGATPELEGMAELLREHLRSGGGAAPGAGRGPSYVRDGNVDVTRLRAFFVAAGRLWRAKPWDVVPSDSDVIRLALPSLGSPELCVSIIGQMGESFGAIVFPSLAAFRRFRERAARGERGFGVRTLSISFEPFDELPEQMRREIEEHALPIVSREGCPLLMPTDGDETPRPIDDDAVTLGHACASALARFFERHDRWSWSPAWPVNERFTLDDVPGAPEAVITAPYPEELRVARQPRAAAAHIDLSRVRATTDMAITRVCGDVWGAEFARRHEHEMRDALEEIGRVAGDALTEDDIETFGSLPLVWAALWRPMSDGRTGIDAARRFAKLKAPVLAAALDRLAMARGTLIEIVSIDASRERLIARDLFDGTRYDIAGATALLTRLTRWTRAFTVLVDRGDGAWMFPSVFVAMPKLSTLEPTAIVEGVRRSLATLGVDPDEVDPAAPHAGLARWAGVALAAVMAMPADDDPEQKKPLYPVTSDNEPVLFHEAELRLPKAAAARFVKNARAVSDFSVSGRAPSVSLSMIDRTLTSVHPEGESIANLDVEGSAIHASTVSAGRHERLLARIAELAGAEPKVVKLERSRAPGAAAEDGPSVRRVTIACGLPLSQPPGPNTVRALVIDRMRRELDNDVPMLGGKPRALVASEAGRIAVSAWLREAERLGVPNAAGGAFLDLDPLRAELGLPTVDS